MASRKPQPALPAIDRSHIVEDTARAGELVGIKDHSGVYRISCEALNTNSGAEWVELMGPLGKGGAQFRAVRPDQVRTVTRRQASMVQA